MEEKLLVNGEKVLFSDRLKVHGHMLAIFPDIQRQFGTVALVKTLEEYWDEIPTNTASLNSPAETEYDTYFVVIEDRELAVIRSTFSGHRVAIIQPGRPIPDSQKMSAPILSILPGELLPISKKKPTYYWSILSPPDIRRKYGVDEMLEWSNELDRRRWNSIEITLPDPQRTVRGLMFKSDVVAIIVRHRKDNWIGLCFMWKNEPYTPDDAEHQFEIITGMQNEGYKVNFAQQRTR